MYKLKDDSVMNERGNRALIAVPDSDAAVPITVRRDGMQDTVYVPPIHDFFFNLDRNRFAFPHKMFADIDDAGKAYYTYRHSAFLLTQYKTPYWSMDFIPPVINWFGYGLKDMSDGSLFGGAIALNYNYKQGHSLSFEVGGSVHGFTPQPVIITASTPYKYSEVNGWYVSVKEVRTVGRFEFGYGAYFGGHYGKSYYITLYSKDDSLGYSRNAYGLGLSGSAYFRLLNYLSIGGSFQPQLISFDKSVSVGFESVYNVGVRIRIPHLREN